MKKIVTFKCRKYDSLSVPLYHIYVYDINNNLITDKYKLFEVIDGSKHYGALALGGFFSYHITKGSSKRIASGIVKKVPSDLFEDSEGFKNDIVKNYERPVEEKVGLPTLLDYIEEHDSTFNIERFSEELNLICNKNFSKTKVTTATFKIEVPTEDNEKTTAQSCCARCFCPSLCNHSPHRCGATCFLCSRPKLQEA